MYERIKQHGNRLLKIFPDATIKDPIALCKKIKRIDTKMHRIAELYCNGDCLMDQWELFEASALKNLDNILGFKATGIPVFINGDPRGYALKIEDSYIRDHDIDIYRDWGGYGILAPEFDGDN